MRNESTGGSAPASAEVAEPAGSGEQLESGEPLAVAVIGAAGRMGSEACRAVEAAPGLRLVATRGRGDDLGDLGGADVAVELSTPEAAPDNVAHCLARGISCVVGTSGWHDERLARLQEQVSSAPATRRGGPVGVLIAPNFAIGAILLMRFAAEAARFYESVEIIELHHPDKVDAPSGTAARTARLVAEARAEAGLGAAPDATTDDPLGARGASVDGIPVHAVRLRGLTASQEVLLGGPGELLSLRHDSFDRASFMPGVIAGIRGVGHHPGVTVGLEHYLGID